MNQRLALHGGPKACKAVPKRRLFGEEEKQAVDKLFDKAIESGDAFGYNGEEEKADVRGIVRALKKIETTFLKRG